METRVLREAARRIAAECTPPPRIVGVLHPTGTGITLVLEGPGSTVRRRLVLDVDPDHSTLHLEPAARDSFDGRPDPGFGSRLAGGWLAGVAAGPEPRSVTLRIRRPEDVAAGRSTGEPEPSAEAREDLQARQARRVREDPLGARLIAEWFGRGANLRIVDARGILLERRPRGGGRVGAPDLGSPADSRPLPAQCDPAELADRLESHPPHLWPREIVRTCRDVSRAAGYDALLAAEGTLPDAETPALASRETPTGPDAGSPSPDRLHRIAELALRHLGAEPPQPLAYRLYRVPGSTVLPVPFGGGRSPAAAIGLPCAIVSDRPLRGLEELEQTSARRASEPDLMELLGRAYRALLSHANAEKRRADQLKRYRGEARRLARLRGKLAEEVGSGTDGARLRRFGEAILANLHAIRRGDTKLVCPDDWSGGDPDVPLEVPLDPARSPTDVADDYFRRARRWERGAPLRRRRIEKLDRAMARLSVAETRVKDAESVPGEEKAETWLREALKSFYRERPSAAGSPAPARAPGAGRASRSRPSSAARTREAGAAGKRGSRPQPRFTPRTYRTSDGWTVVVGRSNEENDYVSHVLGRQEDYWFHAHGVPGSHVLLRREGRKDNPSARTIEEAAAIAAFYSKARNSKKAPVIYTLKKYVRKPRKGKPGLALCTREKMVMVRPKDPEEGKAPEWMED